MFETLISFIGLFTQAIFREFSGFSVKKFPFYHFALAITGTKLTFICCKSFLAIIANSSSSYTNGRFSKSKTLEPTA